MRVLHINAAVLRDPRRPPSSLTTGAMPPPRWHSGDDSAAGRRPYARARASGCTERWTADAADIATGDPPAMMSESLVLSGRTLILVCVPSLWGTP